MPTIILRLLSDPETELHAIVIRQRKLLKYTKVTTIIEDFTNLNVELMNRLRSSDDVEKCWSWNGYIFVLLKMARKYMCDRFKLFRKLTSNHLTVYLSNSGDCLVVCVNELGGNCVHDVCLQHQ